MFILFILWLIFLKFKEEIKRVVLDISDLIFEGDRVLLHFNPLTDHCEHDHPDIDQEASINLFSVRE